MQLHDKLTKAFIQVNVFWSFQLGFCLSISDHVVSYAHFFVSYRPLHVEMKKQNYLGDCRPHGIIVSTVFCFNVIIFKNLFFNTFFIVILNIHVTQVPQ